MTIFKENDPKKTLSHMTIFKENDVALDDDFFSDFNWEETPKATSKNFSTSSAAATAAENSGGPPALEELEWLVDKDAFPPVETWFDISFGELDVVLKSGSPNSVLENSTTGSGSGTGFLTVPRSFPVRPRSKNGRKKRAADFFKLPTLKELVPPQTRPSNRASMGRKCSHCQADKTPQWRMGPLGPKTLCNACGVRYKSGRLVPEYRPVNSPTFSSVLHSNSHRKVLEMRKKKYSAVEGGEACEFSIG